MIAMLKYGISQAFDRGKARNRLTELSHLSRPQVGQLTYWRLISCAGQGYLNALGGVASSTDAWDCLSRLETFSALSDDYQFPPPTTRMIDVAVADDVLETWGAY